MGFSRFLAAPAVGTLPLAGLISFVGEDSDRLTTALIWISTLSLAALVGSALYHKRRA